MQIRQKFHFQCIKRRIMGNIRQESNSFERSWIEALFQLSNTWSPVKVFFERWTYFQKKRNYSVFGDFWSRVFLVFDQKHSGHFAYICSFSPHGGLPKQIDWNTGKNHRIGKIFKPRERAESELFRELSLKFLADSWAEIWWF